MSEKQGGVVRNQRGTETREAPVVAGETGGWNGACLPRTSLSDKEGQFAMDMQEAVADFVVARIETTATSLYATSIEFLEAGQAYRQRHDAFLEDLSEPMKKRLDELELAQSRDAALMEKALYEQGFRDCVALLRLMGLP